MIFSSILFVSCNTLPPGNPPPPNQPIISDSSSQKQTVNPIGSQKDKIVIPAIKEKIENATLSTTPSTTIKTQTPDGADAVNYMIIMLATKCKPIATAQTPPAVLNEFTVSGNTVNDFPLQVWYRLINNSMIKPISNPQENYQYILVSNIEKIQSTTRKKNKSNYFWKMSLLEANNRRVTWSTSFNFEE